MTKQKRQLVILCGLFGLLAFTLYYMWASSATGPASAGTPGTGAVGKGPALDLKDIYLKRNPRRTGGKKEVSFQEIDPSIHLNKLETFDPGEPLNARNMFSAEAPPPPYRPLASRSPQLTAGSSSLESGGSGANPGPSVARPAPPPTLIINLKFFGTKTDIRQRTRQGFFAEGDEVFLAAEGDLLANRYRVIRIGDSSAEVEEVSSKTRRQINLAQ